MATLTSAASSTSAAQIVAVNSSRGGLVIENSDANTAYILLGPGTVSSTNFSFSLAQNANAFLPNCTDRVSAIWGTAGSGKIYVTEYDN